tara:strand:- start:2578 stop:2979 length:402 start_codon:yes stop_codon:yes gene_type:complete
MQEIIDQVWQSANAYDSALAICERLDPGQQEALRKVLIRIADPAGHHKGSDLKEATKEVFVKPKQGNEELASIVTLLMFAIHHSDGLVDLPLSMREARLKDWANETGIGIKAVREAIILGPYKLKPLLKSIVI